MTSIPDRKAGRRVIAALAMVFLMGANGELRPALRTRFHPKGG
jgi:hypothetical protein